MATKGKKNKALPKRRKRSGPVGNHLNTRRLHERAYDAFHERDDVDEALELLERIDAAGPMSMETMDLYLDVAHRRRDFDQYARIAMLMAERSPTNPNAVMVAASGAYASMQPVSAMLFFERFLELSPNHPGAETARKEAAKLREKLPEILDAFRCELPKDPPRIASVEKILHVMKLGRFDEVIHRAQQHLGAYPDDLRIRNNWAEALAMTGDKKQAWQIIDETIHRAPTNFFARAVRCRLAYFLGRTKDSQADAETLVTMQPRQISDLTKAAQSFAYIGDEDKVRWAMEEAERRKWLDDSPIDAAMLLNFHATGLARRGDEKTAQRHWKRAVKLAGNSTLAQANLDDSKEPRDERWGPAYLDLRDWMSPPELEELRSVVGQAKGSDQADKQLHRATRRFLKDHPETENILPGMLDRGDAASQQMAVWIAAQSQRPEIQEALLDYARGSRGTDETRYNLLMRLNKTHSLSSPISMHIRGEVCQIELIGFEITDEPTVPEDRSEEVQRLIEDAAEALNNGDGKKAETLLRQVHRTVPDQPDVMNNLAMALMIQGRKDESDELIDEVIRQHPDYFFGNIAAANRNIQKKKFDEALDILIHLQRRPQLHSTEFFALVNSMVHAQVGKRQYATAKRWVKMLEDYAPDHPNIDTLTRFVEVQERPMRAMKQLLGRS